MNYSERFTAIMANIGKEGGSPHNTAESVRSKGLVEETELPFDESIETWDDFYYPKPMKPSLLVKGQQFLRDFDFRHEWVFTGSPAIEEKVRLIKEALKRSPVGMSVYAWVYNGDGICIKNGDDNHWVCCYGFRDDIRAWKIFDSYTNTYKLYSMDSDIGMAKLYWLKKKERQLHANPWISLFHLLFDRFNV